MAGVAAEIPLKLHLGCSLTKQSTNSLVQAEFRHAVQIPSVHPLEKAL